LETQRDADAHCHKRLKAVNTGGQGKKSNLQWRAEWRSVENQDFWVGASSRLKNRVCERFESHRGRI
jgi:hypothetical protein